MPLYCCFARVGVKTVDDRIEKDPDRRVQDALDLAFSKFAELQTVRQMLL